jgi:hypothetical protein
MTKSNFSSSNMLPISRREFLKITGFVATAAASSSLINLQLVTSLTNTDIESYAKKALWDHLNIGTFSCYPNVSRSAGVIS